MDYLIDPRFQRFNRLFVLSFEDIAVRKGQTRYFSVEIEDYSAMIDGKKDMRTYENNQKIATGEEDDYATGYLLDYIYFKDYYKMIAIDLNKEQELSPDPESILFLFAYFKQINVTGNLTPDGNTTIFLIIEEARESILDFSNEIVL